MAQRILAFDPGAERMGWAVLEKWSKGPLWCDSGALKYPRGELGFQEYKLKLINFWANRIALMLSVYDPSEIVAETVPAVGGGNFVVATQSYLANTAISVVLGGASNRGYTISQIGATTVKAKIGGSNKATKVRVRNGVYQLLPGLREDEERVAQWKKVFDESDAIAIGLAHLGYSIG